MIKYNGNILMDVNDVSQYLHCSHATAKQSMFRFGEVQEGIKCDHCGRSLTSVYVKEDDYKKWIEKYPRSYGRYRRRVVCVETGEIYPSVEDAALSMGKKASSLYALLAKNKSRGRQSFSGKHWKYVEEDTGEGGENDA